MELFRTLLLALVLWFLPSLVVAHDDDEEGLCFCCPWKLILSSDCLFSNNTPSFEEKTLTLSFRHASSARKRHIEGLMNVALASAWTGLGYGPHNESILEGCQSSDHDNFTRPNYPQLQGWSLNFKAYAVSSETMKNWVPFEKLVRDYNQEVPTDVLDETLLVYREQVFKKFERFEECGKVTVNQERRCFHHVMSPLEVDEKHYWKFLDNPLDETVR